MWVCTVWKKKKKKKNQEISAAIISWNCMYLSIIRAASNLQSRPWPLSRDREAALSVSLCDRLILQSIIFMGNKFHKEARFLVTRWNTSTRFCLHLNDMAVVCQVLIKPPSSPGAVPGLINVSGKIFQIQLQPHCRGLFSESKASLEAILQLY